MRSRSTFSTIILIIFLSISLAFSPIQAKPADAWMAIPSVYIKTMLDKIRIMINGIIVGALKQAAIQALNKSISGFVSGNGPQTSKIISNYNDFLYNEPRQKADLYINDYISQTTGGQSSSNYSTEGISLSSPASGGAGYMSQLASMAKNNISARTTMMKPTYVGNPGDNLFANGNMDNFNSYLSGINNPWAYDLYVQQKYQEKLTREQEIAKAEALAGRGYKSVKQGDQIITPGALIETTMANALDVGNKVLAGATDPAEVITSIVQQLIMQTMQNGIGNAKSNSQKSSTNSSNGSNWTNPDTGQAYNSGGGTAEPWKNPDTGSTYDSGSSSSWTDPDTGSTFQQ